MTIFTLINLLILDSRFVFFSFVALKAIPMAGTFKGVESQFVLHSACKNGRIMAGNTFFNFLTFDIRTLFAVSGHLVVAFPTFEPVLVIFMRKLSRLLAAFVKGDIGRSGITGSKSENNCSKQHA